MTRLGAIATRAIAASSALLSASAPPKGIVVEHEGSSTLVASWADATDAHISLDGAHTAGGFIPLTVVRTTDVGHATCAWVKNQIEHYKKVDDVITDKFLEYIYLDGATSYANGLRTCLKEAYGTTAVLSCNRSPEVIQVTALKEISSGPYVLYLGETKGTLGKVYRVYRDAQQAFMSSILPSTESAFIPSPFNTESDATVGVAVPSRLYSLYADSKKYPMHGIRVGVKDIIDIKGLRTSNGNRAWYEVYEPVNASAPAIQTLVDYGAEIVGKTKTAQFANNDRPTADWVDYHDAFNARADGYQDPGASSAGSGAAIGAYYWLDVAIGTDTGGSIRIPASYNGIYGLRPTFDSLSTTGVMPEGPFFDAVGYHTRSPYTLQSFGKTWMGSKHKSYPSFPKTVYVPDDLFPALNATNPAAYALYNEWISKLANFLDADIDTRNISVMWAANASESIRSYNIYDYLHLVGFDLEWKYQYETVFVPFYKEYAEKYDGRMPFRNPTVAARIDHYINETSERWNQSRTRQLEFKEFFTEKVVKPDNKSCSSGLWLTPSNPGRIGYINVEPVAAPVVNETALTFSQLYYSVFSGSPEAVVPIGQVPFNSTISNHTEYSPVTIDILARPGCDYVLLDLIAALADAGLLDPSGVKTGRTPF
ncbi:amidase signature enzyme [Clavulina sp. PMI_390]|nr:amidase signature enzyme [Clavulina sp. PMI_390]